MASTSQTGIDLKCCLDFLQTYGRFRYTRLDALKEDEVDRIFLSKGLSQRESTENFYASAHEEIASILLSPTPFQKYLNGTHQFRSALETVTHSRPFFAEISIAEYDFIYKSRYGLDKERDWRLQYIFACGIYAFHFHEEAPPELFKHNKLEGLKFSRETKSATSRLRISIKSDGFAIPPTSPRN